MFSVCTECPDSDLSYSFLLLQLPSFFYSYNLPFFFFFYIPPYFRQCSNQSPCLVGWGKVILSPFLNPFNTILTPRTLFNSIILTPFFSSSKKQKTKKILPLILSHNQSNFRQKRQIFIATSHKVNLSTESTNNINF